MAELSVDPHVIDDEDLEDGEIETDEENDKPAPAPTPAPTSTPASNDADVVTKPAAKKPKISDDELKAKSDAKQAKAERKIAAAKSTNSSKKATVNEIASKKQLEGNYSIRLFLLAFAIPHVNSIKIVLHYFQMIGLATLKMP